MFWVRIPGGALWADRNAGRFDSSLLARAARRPGPVPWLRGGVARSGCTGARLLIGWPYGAPGFESQFHRLEAYASGYVNRPENGLGSEMALVGSSPTASSKGL